MTGEITRKSVLIECLQIMREELNICSSKYNGLEPKKGMEEAWEQARVKVKILEELIHAYESEPVRQALANWQNDVMDNGPSAMDADDLVKAARQLAKYGVKRAGLYIPKNISAEEKQYLIDYINTHIPNGPIIYDPEVTAEQVLTEEPLRL